jgi:hypothetical protein
MLPLLKLPRDKAVPARALTATQARGLLHFAGRLIDRAATHQGESGALRHEEALFLGLPGTLGAG